MRSQSHKGGLTASERCVLASILAIIAIFLAVACLQIKNENDIIAARNTVFTLEKAVLDYCERHGAPRDTDGDGITTTAEIVAQLKRWRYVSADFDGRDPWGVRYVIVLRRDYDAHPQTRRDFLSMPLNDYARGVQVFSAGPNRRTSPRLSDMVSVDDIRNRPGS